MYKCQITKRNSREGDKLNKIVIKTRSRQYKHWDREAEEEWLSHGTEIVQEINASEAGVQLWESWSPVQREAFAKSL